MLKDFLVTAFIFYIVVLVLLYAFQRRLIYVAGPEYAPPKYAGFSREVQELSVRTKDGLDLVGWFAPAQGKSHAIIFFHGNADRLQTAAGIMEPYIADGYGFLLAEYRGYSGLRGMPSEEGLYADARAYIDALLARGVASKNIILMGHSLGTGVAVQMATEYNVGGVILLAPYMTLADIAKKTYFMFPVDILLKDRFESEKKIDHLNAPLFIAHGLSDTIVPFEQGQKLFDMAREPKKMLSMPGYGHCNLFVDEFYRESKKWIEGLTPSNP